MGVVSDRCVLGDTREQKRGFKMFLHNYLTELSKFGILSLCQIAMISGTRWASCCEAQRREQGVENWTDREHSDPNEMELDRTIWYVG